MPDTTNSANQAGVITIVNPHQDAVTIAWSKVDVCTRRLAELGPELDRLQDKLDRAKADVAAAEEYINANREAVAARSGDLKAAEAELADVSAANPGAASAALARRDQGKAQRRKELQDALAELEGN